ncbi:MAG: glycine cleavage system protein T, partial [Candidatus Omnitrophica bacterium]|nr:glycine cleavage system protein T [Candidatus Omnitrophota bacterium]
SNAKIPALWSLILEDKRVKPAGLGARDTLRLEMGYSLYGQDIDENTSPLEAGLGKFVDFNKDFMGKTALLKQKKEGVKNRLIGFMTNSRRSARHNYKIFSRNDEIGFVTSGSFSPSLSCGIGMGYVTLETGIGGKILLKEGNIEIEATTTERPFYKQGTARFKD